MTQNLPVLLHQKIFLKTLKIFIGYYVAYQKKVTNLILQNHNVKILRATYMEITINNLEKILRIN